MRLHTRPGHAHSPRAWITGKPCAAAYVEVSELDTEKPATHPLQCRDGGGLPIRPWSLPPGPQCRSVYHGLSP